MKKFLIILILVIIPVGLAGSFIFFLNNRPGKQIPIQPHMENELRIGALNVNWLGYNGNAEMTAEILAKSARDNELDILLLQEYKSHWQLDENSFTKLFRKDYKYIFIEDECVCISKFPVNSHKRVRFDDFSDSYSDIIVTLPDKRKVEIFAVHLMTTGINNFTGGEASSMSGMGVSYTFFGNEDIRRNQAVSLVNRIQNVHFPLIVAGDFNCVPFAAPYRKMISSSLKDSFFTNGRGSGSTYRGLGNIFRIDYIFYGDGLQCIDSRIVDDNISDHRMMLSSFLLNAETD